MINSKHQHAFSGNAAIGLGSNSLTFSSSVVMESQSNEAGNSVYSDHRSLSNDGDGGVSDAVPYYSQQGIGMHSADVMELNNYADVNDNNFQVLSDTDTDLDKKTQTERERLTHAH